MKSFYTQKILFILLRRKEIYLTVEKINFLKVNYPSHSRVTT